ncbi:MAG TPA: hypothetical protein VFV54_01820 [Thermoanaerobaculia bacterium]|nr:hypothetical protein [Thermoanaerobaculia bacterium]
MSSEHTKQHIEIAIDRARDRVSERIDALDERIREQLNFKEMAAEHAPQLIAAGAAFGFLLGLGIPRVLLRTVQLGLPVGLAVMIAKRRRAAASHDPAVMM